MRLNYMRGDGRNRTILTGASRWIKNHTEAGHGNRRTRRAADARKRSQTRKVLGGRVYLTASEVQQAEQGVIHLTTSGHKRNLPVKVRTLTRIRERVS